MRETIEQVKLNVSVNNQSGNLFDSLSSRRNSIDHDLESIKCQDKSTTHELQQNDTYQVAFYLKYALIANIIHWSHLIFGPLSIPVLKRCFGVPLLKNMYFRITLTYFMVQLMPWMWNWMTLILVSLNLQYATFYLPYVATTGTIMFVRTILVSVKYGYYTKKMWETMNTSILSPDYLKKELLIPAWVNVPKQIALRELSNSYIRQHINPYEIWIHFKKPIDPNSFEELKKIAQEIGLNAQLLNREWIPTLLLSQCLTGRVIQRIKTKKEVRFVTYIAVLYALLPVLMNLGAWGIFEDALNPMDMMYMIMNIMISFMMCRAFFVFILVGVYDFSRRRLMMAQCSALVSHIDFRDLCVNFDVGKIDLTNVNTILSWYHMRAAFLDFGKRYTLRIFLYTSLILPVCLLVILGLFLMVFGVVGQDNNFYLIPWLFLTAIVMVILTYMTLSAVSLNKYFAIHRDIFLIHIAQIRRQMKQENETSVRVLEFVVQKLHQDEVLHPVKILGVTMDSNFITKLLAVGVSGLFAALRVFYTS